MNESRFTSLRLLRRRRAEGPDRMKWADTESGFSLVELIVATGLFLIVSTVVTSALMQMTNSQKTIWNRTETHSGVRGATELLQQEVGRGGASRVVECRDLERTCYRCLALLNSSDRHGELDVRHVRWRKS